MKVTIPQIAQYVAYLALLLIAGGLEYYKLLPAGSVGGLFLLIVGHFFGNMPTLQALKQNTQATRENTEATSANALQAPVGPMHLVHHYETPPTPTATPAPPEPQPIILTTPVNRSVPQVPFPDTGTTTQGYITPIEPNPAYSATTTYAGPIPGTIHFGDSQMIPTVQPTS